MKAVLLIVVSFGWVFASAIYVQTEKKDAEEWTDDIYDYNDQDGGLWGELLEQWTVRNASNSREREGRVLSPNHKYIPTSGFFITKRIGEVAELEPHLRPPGKVINGVTNVNQFKPSPPYNPYQNNQQQGAQIQSQNYPNQAQNSQNQQNYQQQILPSGPQAFANQQPYQVPNSVTVQQQAKPQKQREVSETDLYLLGAIEKLVFRVDYMEQRLRRTEQLVYYLMQGNNPKDDTFCPVNFTKVGQNCYHFGMSREINWQSANNMCKTLGGHLAEFETKPEYKEVTKYLLGHPTDKGKEFWLGGLNPGLLWIWSNSARPINANTNLTMAAATSPLLSETASAKSDSGAVQKVAQTSTKTKNKVKRNSSAYDEIKGSGRCLRLSYNTKKGKYYYYGHECSDRQFYMCEFKDRSLENEISRVSKELKLGN